MKVKVIRSKIFEALGPVQNIVGGKGSLAVLQNVLIEAKDKEIRLTTTNLDISVISKCEAETIEEGKTTLPVKLLYDAIGKLVEGEVVIDVDQNERATITSGKAKFKLAGIPQSEFPKLPTEENAYEYKLPEMMLKEMLRKVAYAASQDDTRRSLKGVLMSFKDNQLTLAATDGRRLAVIEKEVEFSKEAEREIVLPSRAVTELIRSVNDDGEMIIKVQNTQICVKTSKFTIYSKLIDERYPNYQQVIPKEGMRPITIDRQLLIDALERASVMSKDESHSTRLIFSNNKLTVNSAAMDIGEAKDEVAIEYCDEEVEIIFNPIYVLDPLRVIDNDEIKINIRDGHSPAIITCEDIRFMYVMMPLRIS